MAEDVYKVTCFVCKRQFQYSHGIYAGTLIPNYQIIVCKSCYESNWDGWTSPNMEKIIEHLKENNLAIPKMNSKGWLPRDG
jgi:hypothetical protein